MYTNGYFLISKNVEIHLQQTVIGDEVYKAKEVNFASENPFSITENTAGVFGPYHHLCTWT